jgi:RNA polymerase sigma factor (sigma-70 family)
MASIGRDPEAFEAFYREHVEAVLRFVARRVGDPHRAADLTAEVFLAVIDSADSYRPSRGTPTAWLYGIARNVLNAERRRKARELRASGRIAGRRHVDVDDVVRLEERIDAEAGARELYRGMDRLSEGERAVLELVALDGLSLAETAKVLRISRPNARVRLHRARRKLHDHLERSVATEPSEARS